MNHFRRQGTVLLSPCPKWDDLLTSYDGKAITYDGVGNPLTYGSNTYTWKHGRQLASLSDGTTTWSYTYNADGLRTERTNGTTTYGYVYSGSSLAQMTAGTDTLHFAYDANGTPMALTLNGTDYYYVTNLQGDVIAILNDSGTAVVTYTYDAWGKLLSTDGTMATTLGTLNPLRYRGYVYDQETGLYYLQSRYYDPEIGRFINADAFVSTGQGLLGNNMFVYCLNNPIVCADDQGLAAILLLDIYGPSHIGIMAQDENGAWWHFYWGAAPGRDQAICALGIYLIPVTWCVEYSGELTLSAINDSGQFSGDYESMTYIPGDFSACIDEMKNPSEMYHLYFNNCSQKSLEILAIAETEYQSIFMDASNILIPSTAYTYVTVGIALTKVKNKINFKSLLPKRPISFPIKGGTHASCI